jgi:4-alpha-glucanotransferase
MITLVLAFHNHQPVGNFGWVIEEAYAKSYLPLMEVLAEFPELRFAQHYTGILLDWFAEQHPEFLTMIGAGVRDGRIELISGGYYEPILAMLPERDRQAQLRKLNERIERDFGSHPTGMWLAERVWEPSLPATLADAGLRYTFLDDTHFKHAGLVDSDLTGYFLTEDQGKPLAVLPIDKRLRYTMPFESPETTLEYLHALNRKGQDRLVVFADDGEKFGTWPGTFETVYSGGWLRRFCELLAANTGWVRTVRPGEALATLPPAGRLYLPTASYAEMLHWALPSARSYLQYEKFEEHLKEDGSLDSYSQFVRGGFWRNFLVKYPEANAMQKKMLRVSQRLEAARGVVDAADDGTVLLASAAEHLMAGQCNCPYWHGVFGGLYLSNIRAAIYRELITAERDLDRLERRSGTRVEVVDYDFDGFDEILVEGAVQNVYLAPARGGGIFELDHKPARYNFCDLLQRRREGYHAQLVEAAEKAEKAVTTAGAHEEAHSDTGARSIHDSFKVKEEGLERRLAYDRYRHGILLDHFVHDDITPATLRQGSAQERGDFVTGRYEYAWGTGADGRTRVHLRRRGTVDAMPVALEKILIVDDPAAMLDVTYQIASLDGRPLTGAFGIEMSYSLSAGNEPDRYYEIDGRRIADPEGRLSSEGDCAARRFALVDEWLGVRLEVELARPARLLRTPIETVSLSEDGFERNYQGSLLMALWDLGGATEWQIALRQRIVPL